MKEIDTKVIKKTQLGTDALELELEILNGVNFSFKPGQFVEFCIDRDVRMYSIVSLEKDLPRLKFLIKILEFGVGSDFVRNLKIGDPVEIRGPYGNFTEEIKNESAIFLATGVGVAPFIPVIDNMLQSGTFKSECALYLGVKTEYDILYGDFFKKLEKEFSNFHFFPVLSQPNKPWTGIKGRLTNFISENSGKLTANQYFLCGGLAAVSDIRDMLILHGVSARKIEQEIFT